MLWGIILKNNATLSNEHNKILRKGTVHMAFQSSIHFDPTALLIIKNEIDNSIKLVESGVTTLVEDQSLPFGIEDALTQLEQCAQVLALIDMPLVAKLAHHITDLMRLVMQNPQQVDTQKVIAMSEGTTVLRRYVEFMCLREVNVPQFLLDPLNQVEKALGIALTREGAQILPVLETVDARFNLPEAPSLEKSQYVHKLYKLSLNNLLKQQETEVDLHGLKIVGAYLAGYAQNLPSQQYWKLVFQALNQIDHLLLTGPRLRILVQIERSIARFFENLSAFQPHIADTADVICLCISQEDQYAEHIRQLLNLNDEVMTDSQLQVFSRHLYGPDLNTIHTIIELLTADLEQVRNDIEYHYQDMDVEKSLEIRNSLQSLANVFKVLDLSEAASELEKQAQQLSTPNRVQQADFAQTLMNTILSGMNSIGILERHYTPSRLQFRVNNMQISLDRLDDAHRTLLQESQTIVDQASELVVQHIELQSFDILVEIPQRLRELAGAMRFLNVLNATEALNNTAHFVENDIISAQQAMTPEQGKFVLNTLASVALFLEQVSNKQPVMNSTFDIALKGSRQLLPETV